jgi:ATP-dependent DNA helicase
MPKPLRTVLSYVRRESLPADWDRLITVRRGCGGLVFRGDRKGYEILTKDMYSVRAGDFLISKRQVVHGAWAMVPPEFDRAHVSKEYACLRAKPDKLWMPYFDWLSRTERLQHEAFICSYGVDTQVVLLDIDLLHLLVFDDEAAVDAIVDQAVTDNPGLDARRFRRYLQDRVQIVHGIASFLLAHLEFAAEGLAERAVNLARNTLAHYLADEVQRTQIETVFRKVAERLLEGATTEEMRATLRRSPLAPTTVNTLKTWLEANRAALIQALEAGTLLASISEVILRYNRSTTITALSDGAVMPLIIENWVGGVNFAGILRLLSERDIRIGGNNRYPTVEDAVAICESGLGYEGAMILATIADLAESDEGELPGALALLQRQMKSGLASVAELGFFEAGFADRIVAQALAASFPNVSDRQSARLAVRDVNAQVQAGQIVGQHPAYFASVLDELLA